MRKNQKQNKTQKTVKVGDRVCVNIPSDENLHGAHGIVTHTNSYGEVHVDIGTEEQLYCMQNELIKTAK